MVILPGVAGPHCHTTLPVRGRIRQQESLLRGWHTASVGVVQLRGWCRVWCSRSYCLCWCGAVGHAARVGSQCWCGAVGHTASVGVVQ